MLELGWLVFQWIMIIAGSFCTLLGLLTVAWWFKPPKAPNDSSNRINNIMSWWIGLTRPEVMGTAYKAFRQDVMDNVEDVERKA